MVATPALPLMCLALLAGCSPSYSPDTYASTAVQQASKVEQGVIAGVRKVGVSASGTTGAVTGAAAGGIAGAAVPLGGNATSALTALGGSLIGGLVGSGVERAAGNVTAYEYVVRKADGELLSVTQQDTVPLALGQKVLLIAGPQARVVPDYTVANEGLSRAAVPSPAVLPPIAAERVPPPAAVPSPPPPPIPAPVP